MSENTSLSDEVNIAQENLRLSANTVAKLNNELKIVCNENEELQKRLGDSSRKGAENENKVSILSSEIERLNGIIESKNNELNSIKKSFD